MHVLFHLSVCMLHFVLMNALFVSPLFLVMSSQGAFGPAGLPGGMIHVSFARNIPHLFVCTFFFLLMHASFCLPIIPRDVLPGRLWSSWSPRRPWRGMGGTRTYAQGFIRYL